MCGFNNFDGCKPLNGCGNPIAYAFFCTFTLLVTYVMLNLTIAVILEGFSLSHEDDEPLFEPELLEEFQTKWADIDPKATGFVKVDKMLLLVNLLKPPLGSSGCPSTWRTSSSTCVSVAAIGCRPVFLMLTTVFLCCRPARVTTVRGRIRPLPGRAARHDARDGQSTLTLPHHLGIQHKISPYYLVF